jgi:hypothetical protein
MNKVIISFVQLFLIKQFSFFFATLLRIGVKERHANGKDSIIYSKEKNRYTILALDSGRYRGDLDLLSRDGKFRILHIKQSWTGTLIRFFYNKKNRKILVIDIAQAKDQDLLDIHAKAVDFSTEVLKHLLNMISISCVTTVNNRYLEDYPWILALKKLRVPHVMLYREGLLNSRRVYDRSVYRNKRTVKFHGNKIIVQNFLTKKMFLDSRITTEDQIAVCGSLRMDSFINKINSKTSKQNKRKKFTLFYFEYSDTLFGKNLKQKTSTEPSYHEVYGHKSGVWDGRKALFRELHEVILKMAKNNPNTDFVIKPKREIMESESWNFYKQVVRESNIDIDCLSNYNIEPDIDVSKLIIDSSVICGLQSTTLVESGFAGKMVILPFFNNYMKTIFFEDFGWKDNLHLFEFAKNKDEFESLVLDGLVNYKVSESIQNERVLLFEKYFFRSNIGAVDCYSNEIIDVIESDLVDKDG